MTSAFRIGMPVALLGSALLLSGFTSPAAAAPHGFNGAWACSSSLDHSPIGDGDGSIVSLSRTIISGDSVLSRGIAAVETGATQVVAESTATGSLSSLGNGIIEIASTLTPEGGDPVQTLVRCIGMTKLFGSYQEMHCIDLTDEGEGNNQVSRAICKRQ